MIDETAGDLTLQRGLLGTQSLIIHVVYKHKDIQLPSRTGVLWLDFKTSNSLQYLRHSTARSNAAEGRQWRPGSAG